MQTPCRLMHSISLYHHSAHRYSSALPQMILDKKFAGTLDQGAGCLEVFEEPAADTVYPTALEIFESMGRVVDTLFTRSQKVVA